MNDILALKNDAALMIVGQVASSGLGRGHALVCDRAEKRVILRRRLGDGHADREIDRFNQAVVAAEKKLLEIQNGVRRSLGEKEAKIFDAQLLLLKEGRFHRMVRKLCREERVNAEAAVEDAVLHLTELFESLEDPYLRERAAELHDVGRRILDHLAEYKPGTPDYPADAVLVLKELMSSAMAQFEASSVRGLVVEKGGVTTHATILARALGIPMVVRVDSATEKIREGDMIIVDALAGRVFVNPGSEILRTYDQLERDLRSHQSELRNLVDVPAITLDGTEVKLSANIGQTADAVTASRVKAHGAGLYRTEFVFLVRDDFPSEDEQYGFYRATAEHLAPFETVVRVLDIGGDKMLPYFPLPRQTNPALGCRGMRLLLAHRGVLRTQLRAILRLSASHPVSILLPMITGVDDLREAKAIIEEVKAAMQSEGIPHNSKIPVGAMIETPSAAILAGRIAAEVDFINVGTNDLVQFMLASDRSSDDMDSSYEPLHPAMVHVLASLTAVAQSRNKPICLCGEIASEPSFAALLLGLGFRHLSVAPGRLLEVKHAIRSTDLSAARRLATTLLETESAQDVRTLVDADWNRRKPVSSPEMNGLQ